MMYVHVVKRIAYQILSDGTIDLGTLMLEVAFGHELQQFFIILKILHTSPTASIYNDSYIL